MYINGPHIKLTRIAAEELEPYRIVILNATDLTKVEYPAAQYDGVLFGITLTHADAGAQVDVCVAGFCQLRVDGNAAGISAGEYIVNHDAAGYGEAMPTTAATTFHHIAQAWEAATADGALISVEINKGSITHPAAG